MKPLWILVFLVNIFLLGSVFDIYFKSPIVHVGETYSPNILSGISRVVFFVADGLRADTFFDNPNLRPYLTSKINALENITFGISDTRVPTESRPGHIAIFAGFYEDPSAVFTGWKNNLVAFDSVFNRSAFSVCFGSPDVVNMFAKGEAGPRVYSESYPPDWQDFLAENSSKLDTWVYDRLEDYVSQGKLPRHDKLLIFLHLLGIDNTGHATKPHSMAYKHGLSTVDSIVYKVEKMMEDYYNGNDKTLFIFTADHGMTDWGSHGSGSHHETKTPYVIWGNRIKSLADGHLNQSDMTPLVAGSLGLEFPTNSIGKFPTKIWKDKKFEYEAMKTNTLQLMRLMEVKKQDVLNQRHFPIINFPAESHFEDQLVIAQEHFQSNDYSTAITILESVYEDAFKGNVYYERYDQQLLLVFSSITFILLMILVAYDLASGNLKKTNRCGLYGKPLAMSTLLGALLIRGVIGWSLRRLLYGMVPIYLSLLIAFHGAEKIVTTKVKLFGLVLLCSLGVQMLVVSFSDRRVLSIGILFNLCWSLAAQRIKSWTHLPFHLGLAVVVGTLAVFPLVPTIATKENFGFQILGPSISTIAVILFLVAVSKTHTPFELIGQKDKLILTFQLLGQATVPFLVSFPTFTMTRIIAWISLIVSLILPVMTRNRASYESLFLPMLFLALTGFMKLEDPEWGLYSTQENPHVKTSINDISAHRAIRRAWLHLFFVFFSFFGIGNIDSISSFDPSTTRCFVSVFNPWVMMILMLFKIVCPFLLVSSFMRTLFFSKDDLEVNFKVLLIFAQGLSLFMFFKVTNVGSWLEIGTSISHFVIAQCTTLFLLLLHIVANILITYEVWPYYIPITKKPR